MRKNKFTIGLGLLGFLTAACAQDIADEMCGTDRFCREGKVSVRAYKQAEKYREGEGAGQDFAKAVELYKVAAEYGSTSALIGLANNYRKGEGVEKDPAKAVHFYRMAAKTGNPWAQFRLGDRYGTGNGVDKSNTCLDFVASSRTFPKTYPTDDRRFQCETQLWLW